MAGTKCGFDGNEAMRIIGERDKEISALRRTLSEVARGLFTVVDPKRSGLEVIASLHVKTMEWVSQLLNEGMLYVRKDGDQVVVLIIRGDRDYVAHGFTFEEAVFKVWEGTR